MLKGKLLYLYLNELYFKVPPTIHHAQAVNTLTLIQESFQHGGWVVMQLNTTLFCLNRTHYLHCLRTLKPTKKNMKGLLFLHILAWKLNYNPSFFFINIHKPKWVPACCYAPPFLSIRVPPQGAPSCPQKARSRASPAPLHSEQMPEVGLGKAAIFCVQWTAGTFQITAEFKMSTKEVSEGWLFVCPCLLISFSIRPNWFVSTTIHLGSLQYWQGITNAVPDSCLDVFCLFKSGVLHLNIEYKKLGWQTID